MIAAATVLAVTATIASPSPPPHFWYQGLRLGDSVAKVIAREGSPNVVTTDVGHVWTWERGGGRIRLTTDDDGVVRMIDVLPAQNDRVVLNLASAPPKTLVFGTLSAAAADARMGAPSGKGSGNFPDSGAKADFRAYRLSGNQAAVLLFDAVSRRLGEVFYGDRSFLARSGLLSRDGQSAPHYSAPILQHEGNADYPPTIKEGDAFVRVSVDKRGTVADAQIFVTSGDPQLDRAALVTAKADIFTPANLEGMPADAIVFVRQEFRQLRTH